MDGESARRKPLTYTGQHNTETADTVRASEGILTHNSSARAAKTRLRTPATVIVLLHNQMGHS
jgi:hypothetical protein